VTLAEVQERLASEGLSAAPWSNGPGDRYDAHSHTYDKVLVATAGTITFHLGDGGGDVELQTGDRLELPAGTTHAAAVGTRGVTCLEAHLPAGTLASVPRHLAKGW
jgi:quercetin dioxygenase-like cupin family protein